MNYVIDLCDPSHMNAQLARVHYRHTLVVNSKLLAYAILTEDRKRLLGGILWATPQFTKKRGLFGYPGLLDKWEILVLARFYLIPNSGLIPTQVLADCLGRRITRGKYRTEVQPFGHRLQSEWIQRHIPRYPNSPFVPRLLLSWSDLALPHIERCNICGQEHKGKHEGTIYKAMGWEKWDITRNTRKRTNGMQAQVHEGYKQSWIYRLHANQQVEALGRSLYRERANLV